MKDKEKFFNVFKNFKSLILKKTAEITNYTNWSDEFAREEITDAYKQLYTHFEGIDYTQFTTNELKEHFGFSFWDDNIILIPIWLLKTIKDGTTVYTINGEKIVVGVDKQLDNDNRYGMTAYGFDISQFRDEKIEEVLDGSK